MFNEALSIRVYIELKLIYFVLHDCNNNVSKQTISLSDALQYLTHRLREDKCYKNTFYFKILQGHIFVHAYALHRSVYIERLSYEQFFHHSSVCVSVNKTVEFINNRKLTSAKLYYCLKTIYFALLYRSYCLFQCRLTRAKRSITSANPNVGSLVITLGCGSIPRDVTRHLPPPHLVLSILGV